MMTVSVLITAKNAGNDLRACLKALTEFDDVIVIDSNSQDNTQDICAEYQANYVTYAWNGAYPKKRQWTLENIETKHDYIFFVDVDEVVTPALIEEIKNLDLTCAGYFVKGQYVLEGKVLKHGLKNNKLVLFDKNKVQYPVVDDLGKACMGEMEGHYQPVLNPQFDHEPLGQLQEPLLHCAYNEDWDNRHDRYAVWEADMIKGKKYPSENNPMRQKLKQLFRKLPLRNVIAFLHCYIIKLGFLDGRAGYRFAKSRYDYYSRVNVFLNTNKG